MAYFADQTVPAHKEKIMVHCAATASKWEFHNDAPGGMREITRWHEARGWRDNGYIAGIDGTGSAAMGRDLDGDGFVLEETSAGAKGHNHDTIHIVLFGGHGASANDKFEDHFTPKQGATLRAMIAEINRKAGRTLRLMGHNEVSAKGCPGFNVRQWFDNKPARTSPAQSTTLQATGGAAGAVATGAATVVPQLDGTAQIVVIVCAFVTLGCLAWIARERIRKWAGGQR